MTGGVAVMAAQLGHAGQLAPLLSLMRFDIVDLWDWLGVLGGDHAPVNFRA